MQRKLADAKVDFDGAPLQLLESTVGAALIIKLRDFTAALLERMEKGDAVYFDAATSLHDILVEDFGTDSIMRIERKKTEEIRPISAPKAF